MKCQILLQVVLQVFILYTFPNIILIHSWSDVLPFVPLLIVNNARVHWHKHGSHSHPCDRETSKNLNPTSVHWHNHGFYSISHNPLCSHMLLEYYRPLIYTLGIQGFLCLRGPDLFYRFCFCRFPADGKLTKESSAKRQLSELSPFSWVCVYLPHLGLELFGFS